MHVASQPMLVMEGYDDQTKDLAISVNYAMATQPGNKIYYVEPASSAFDAQSAEIKRIANANGYSWYKYFKSTKICS